MKYSLLFLSVVLIFSCQANPHPIESCIQVPVGSGVVVAKDKVLTVAHVAEHMGFPFVRHPTLDLAIVDYTTDDRPAITLFDRAPKTGDPAWSAGHPLGIPKLQIYMGLFCEPPFISIPSLPGSSGSPVWDSDGKVVGLISNGITAMNGQFIHGAVVEIIDRDWVETQIR